jgi:murein L,D-transpeptidase YcbB/YkuD
LAGKLAELGIYTGQSPETRLEGTLLGALKRFQFSAGLTPDGALGPQTMIHLNSALGSPGPRLEDAEAN